MKRTPAIRSAFISPNSGCKRFALASARAALTCARFVRVAIAAVAVSTFMPNIGRYAAEAATGSPVLSVHISVSGALRVSANLVHTANRYSYSCGTTNIASALVAEYEVNFDVLGLAPAQYSAARVGVTRAFTLAVQWPGRGGWRTTYPDQSGDAFAFKVVMSHRVYTASSSVVTNSAEWVTHNGHRRLSVTPMTASFSVSRDGKTGTLRARNVPYPTPITSVTDNQGNTNQYFIESPRGLVNVDVSWHCASIVDYSG